MVLPLAQLGIPDSLPVAAIAALAAVCHGVRLAGWYHPRIWSQPLLWVLYTGYGWLIVGLILTALAAGGILPARAATHAYTTGAIGVMTLGMMARVSLGHTGRPLTPTRAMAWAFVLMNIAALLRVLPALTVPAWYATAVTLAGLLWCISLAVFVLIYAPMLWRPRADGAGP